MLGTACLQENDSDCFEVYKSELGPGPDPTPTPPVPGPPSGGGDDGNGVVTLLIILVAIGLITGVMWYCMRKRNEANSAVVQRE